jgi:hypothetical protein
MASDTGAPWLLPYPEDTDLVRDGASDIEALAEATATGLSEALGVVQVVTATDSTNRTTTSTSYVDANIQVSITPKDSSNLLLVFWSVGVYVEQTAGSSSFRGALIQVEEVGGSAVPGLNNVRIERRLIAGSSEPAWTWINGTNVGLVTAGSTSARTYKGVFRTRASGLTAALNGTDAVAEGTGLLGVIEIDGAKVV